MESYISNGLEIRIISDERTYHRIWVKFIRQEKVIYSMCDCFNVDFYSRMMELEFNTKGEYYEKRKART